MLGEHLRRGEDQVREDSEGTGRHDTGIAQLRMRGGDQPAQGQHHLHSQTDGRCQDNPPELLVGVLQIADQAATGRPLVHTPVADQHVIYKYYCPIIIIVKQPSDKMY